MPKSDLSDKQLLRDALMTLREKSERGESTDTWYGAETYPHILNEISDRVAPNTFRNGWEVSDYQQKSNKRFRFVIGKLGEARTTEIHTQVQAVIDAETTIQEGLREIGEGPSIDSDWKTKLANAGPEGEYCLKELMNIFSVDETDDLPGYWEPSQILINQLESTGTTPREDSYEVYFPLPIVGKDEMIDVSPVEFNDESLEQTEIHDFRQLCARTEVETGRHLNGDKSPEKAFSEADIPADEGQLTYWKYRCTATSPAHASSKYQTFVPSLIGALEYALSKQDENHGHLHDLTRTEERIDSDGPPLSVAPYHIVCTDRSNPDFGTRAVEHPFESVEIATEELDGVVELLREAHSDRTLKEIWQGAFEAFHDANASQTPENQYFHLWQALEGLVGTGPGDESKEVLNRAQGFLRRVSEQDRRAGGRERAEYLDKAIFDERIDAFRDTRNHFVHGGNRTKVLQRDADALRFVFHILMKGLTGLTDDGKSGNEVHGIYQFGVDGDAEKQINTIEAKLERLRAGNNWSP